MEDNLIDSVLHEQTLRFSGAPWFDEASKLRILIAGLGGIGSYATYAVSRFRPELVVTVDPDSVEYVNMSGQLYKEVHVDLYKTSAISETVSEFSGYTLSTIRSRIEDIDAENFRISDVIICGFDNMDARKATFDRFMSHARNTALLIDGRMSAEFYQTLCVRRDDSYAITKYRDNFLFDDSQAEQTVCSFKQTSFVGMQIGGMIGSLVANYANNLKEDSVKRPIPFLTEFNSASMYFNIEE